MVRVHVWVLALCLGSPVWADLPARHDRNTPVAFNRIDSDANGYVSRVEARSIVAVSQFKSADLNRDGLLDRDEYLALGAHKRTQ